MHIRSEWIWSVLALAVGTLTSILALHADDLQFAVLFLFVQAAVFGFARPDHAWRCAALIAACIPLLLLFNAAVRLPDPHSFDGLARLFVTPLVMFLRSPHPIALREVLPSCLAFAPALVGAYAGAWMSRIATIA